MSLLNQKTLKNSIQFNGVGLHSGKIVNLSINPSEPDTGIVFKRIDVPKSHEIKASWERDLNEFKKIRKKYLLYISN